MTAGPSELPDNARAVRDEDAFDVAAVDRWLRDNASGNFEGVPEVRQFAGGASNLTYLLRYPDRDLVLRRPPAGAKPSSGHDMAREFRIQSLLAPVYPHVTGDGGPVHRSGGAGQRLLRDGTRRRHDPALRSPQDLGLTPENTRELCLRVVDLLIELHGVDPAASGLDEFGRGAGYVERQVRDGPSATRLPAPTTSRTSRG